MDFLSPNGESPGFSSPVHFPRQTFLENTKRCYENMQLEKDPALEVAESYGLLANG